jgi:Sec-independent protein translocase protein TatA
MLGEIFGVDGIVLVIIALVVLFGGAAIPKLARNLGSAKTQFHKGLEENKTALPVGVNEDSPTPTKVTVQTFSQN